MTYIYELSAEQLNVCRDSSTKRGQQYFQVDIQTQ